MTTDHILIILNEAREIFRCTGLDREPDAKQVIDYIEARVKGAEKGKRLLDECSEKVKDSVRGENMKDIWSIEYIRPE